MAHQVRVLLVDDTDSIRKLLRRSLIDGSTEVVGEARDGNEAVRSVEQLLPDLVIMDHNMPGRDGVSATKEIKRRWPHIEVLGYTSTTDEDAAKMLEAGASQSFDKHHVQALVGAVKARSTHRPLRFLLVDDDDDIRMMLRIRLHAGNRKVVGEARHGREAIAMTERLHPDVIVMDLRMPDIDGIEATREIKARWPDVKVIGYSAFRTKELDEAGADATFEKNDPYGLIQAVLDFD